MNGVPARNEGRDQSRRPVTKKWKSPADVLKSNHMNVGLTIMGEGDKSVVQCFGETINRRLDVEIEFW